MNSVSINGRTLTRRQAEVFEMVGSGKSYAHVARHLDIAYATVRTYAEQVHRLLQGYDQMPPKAAIRHFWLTSSQAGVNHG